MIVCSSILSKFRPFSFRRHSLHDEFPDDPLEGVVPDERIAGCFLSSLFSEGA